MLVLRQYVRRYLHETSNTKEFRPVSHIIFDFDDLLMKTEQIYIDADAKMIAKYAGIAYPEEVRQEVLRQSKQNSTQVIIESLRLPLSVGEYREEVDSLLDEMLKEAPLTEGAERLVKHLHKHKIPMAVVTTSGERAFKAATFHYKEFFGLFDHIITAKSNVEVIEEKPSWNIFVVCAKQFSKKPNLENYLVFEDSINGVEAALKANMQVVLVPGNEVPKKDAKKATLVLDSLVLFKPEEFGLPKFDIK